MDEFQESKVKAETLTKEKFEKEANEYLSKLEEYKKLDKLMKQYESNIKTHMINSDMDVFVNDVGMITISYAKHNMFDRSLIHDIKQYYVEQDRVIMRKTLKANKPKKF